MNFPTGVFLPIVVELIITASCHAWKKLPTGAGACGLIILFSLLGGIGLFVLSILPMMILMVLDLFDPEWLSDTNTLILYAFFVLGCAWTLIHDPRKKYGIFPSQAHNREKELGNGFKVIHTKGMIDRESWSCGLSKERSPFIEISSHSNFSIRALYTPPDHFSDYSPSHSLGRLPYPPIGRGGAADSK